MTEHAVRRWSRTGVLIQFAALIRILAEYFRLRHAGGASFTMAEADVWIASGLGTAVLAAAATVLVFLGRDRIAIAIAVATVAALLVVRFTALG